MYLPTSDPLIRSTKLNSRGLHQDPIHVREVRACEQFEAFFSILLRCLLPFVMFPGFFFVMASEIYMHIFLSFFTDAEIKGMKEEVH